MSNTKESQTRELPLIEQEAIHIIQVVSAYFRNEISDSIAKESILNSMKRYGAAREEAAVDEALRVAKDIFDVPTETTADSNTSLFPTKQLKEIILYNLK